MNQVTIRFEESSKAVTASVEYLGEANDQEAMNKAKDLFISAQSFALEKSKVRYLATGNK